MNGHKNVVEVLLRNRANVNIADNNGWTALHVATWHGFTSIVEILLQANADCKSRTKEQSTALHMAAWRGHEEIARVLLDARAEVSATDSLKWTPLHRAARSGSDGIIKMLLDAGANIKDRDKDSRTALHWAAWSGHQGAVALLLQFSKAELAARDSRGRTPLIWAALNSANIRGTHEDTLASFATLLEAKANTNAQDDEGRTALHWAAANLPKAAELLLAFNADPNKMDNDGWTPLHTAAWAGHADAVQMLSGVSDKEKLELLLNELRSATPNTHRYHVDKACSLWRKGQFSEAMASFDISVTLYKKNNGIARLEDVSHEAGCDDCMQDIVGYRHRCLVCLDFDLCQNCFNKPVRVDHPSGTEHAFMSIPTEEWVKDRFERWVSTWLKLLIVDDSTRQQIEA